MQGYRFVQPAGFVSIVLAAAVASAAPTWQPGPSSPAGLTPRASCAMAYDTGRGVTVLFGGTDGSPNAETWEYDGIAWTQGPTAPPGLTPRASHAMVHDDNVGVITLFGGADGPTRYRDTWHYDGTTWTRGVMPPAGLTRRDGHAMAFDAARGVTVLFGGDDGMRQDDTWELGPGGWTQGPTAPAMLVGREGHGMTWDSSRQVVVLFGGLGTFGVLDDTWEYDGATWTSGPAPPPGLVHRSFHGLTFDPVRGRTILFGGADAAIFPLDDTWEYDGASWTQGPVAPAGLGGRNLYGLSWDAGRGVVVLFGGSGLTGPISDTWELAELDDYLVAAGPVAANPNRVTVWDATCAPTVVDFLAYGAGQWGVIVGAAELDGDREEILTGPGPGAVYGPHVRAWDRDGQALGRVNFYAYGTLKFGANVGSAELDLDGWDEILTGAGLGAVFGPHVRAFNFDASSLSAINRINYFAYGTLRYGVNVGDGDVERDGWDEILTGPGAGPNFGPQVRGWDYDGTSLTSIPNLNFNASSAMTGGSTVSGGDVEPDGFDEIVAVPSVAVSFPCEVAVFDFDGGGVAGKGSISSGTGMLCRAGAGGLGGPAGDDVLIAADALVQGVSWDGSTFVSLPCSVSFTSDATVTGGDLGY